MKFILILVTIMFFMLTANAQILSPSQSAAISSYHRNNSRYIDSYKAMNSLNLFIFAVQYDCNNNQIPDWRMVQYDETYKKCVNKIYKKMMSHFTSNFKPKYSELYSQNVELEEELKRKALESVGFKLTTDQYGHRSLDLKNENVTADRIQDAADLLELLTER